MNKNVKVAKNSFLGPPTHPEAKPMFCIVTEQTYYIAPTIAECRRMMKDSTDRSPVEQFGAMDPKAVAFFGRWFDSCGLSFIFG